MKTMKSTIGCSFTLFVHCTKDDIFTQGGEKEGTHFTRTLPAGQDGRIPAGTLEYLYTAG